MWDGTKLWSTYVKRDAFRYESFYASASTDGERLYTIGGIDHLEPFCFENSPKRAAIVCVVVNDENFHGDGWILNLPIRSNFASSPR